MRKWLRSHRIISIIVMAVLVGFISLIVAGYRLQWKWTGFPAKTLWDWLQLLGVLAIPVVAGLGVAWYTSEQTRVSEAESEQRRKAELEKAEQQRQTELKMAEQQRKNELAIAEQRHKTEIEIATDNQREALLQAYLDKMSELILEHGLGESIADEKVNNIARVRTLTVLRRLDSRRKSSVLQFLHESGLIGTEAALGQKYAIIDLRKANLTRANLNHIYLRGVNLKGAKLSGADLSGAILSEAILEEADLSGADLSGTNLNTTRLGRANLSRANLSQSDLREAYLNSANLGDANLRGANLGGAKLSGKTPPERWEEQNDDDMAGEQWRYELLYGNDQDEDEQMEANPNAANLRGANLENADLLLADLRGANLSRAKLTGAALSETNLEGAALNDADLTGATLSHSSLKGATGWTEEQLNKAKSLQGTTMPDGTTRP